MTKTSTILKLLRLQLTVILLFAGQQAFAQKEIVVKGRIFDSLEKTALDSAMVFLKTQETDLSVYTDASGSFFFKGDFIGDSLVLRIHHKNFTAAVRKLSIKSGLADAGNIFLTPVSKMMEDIVITARTPAIVVKKDTTEYTIDSFEKKITPEKRKELFDLYMEHHDRINNWDMVDRSAPWVVGAYLIDKPRKRLYQLAKSKNVWERRTAICF